MHFPYAAAKPKARSFKGFFMHIELTQGYFAEIDDEDYPLVKDIKWHVIKSKCSVYAVHSKRIKNKTEVLLMHRLITKASKGEFVDHIDSNGLNNKKSNLRICSHAENTRNSKVRKHSKTGIRGVREQFGKFQGQVCFNKNRYRKFFNTIEEASDWVEKTRKKLHGDFAYDPIKDSRS